MIARRIQQRAFGGPEVLELVHAEPPDPAILAGGDVLVRIAAAGVNPVDAKTRNGGAVAPGMGEFPFTVGWDLAGTVEAAGAEVDSLAVGDRVFGMARFPQQAAAYADYAVVPAQDVVRTPVGIDDVQAAALPMVALTAWQTLVDVAEMKAGQRVLIQGAGGGVGHLAVQIAHHLGAQVIANARASQRDWLTGLGADQVIEHTDEDVIEVLRGDPVDVVLDGVGGAVGVRSIAVVRPGGVIVVLPDGITPDIQAAADRAGVRAAYQSVHVDRDAFLQIAQLVEKGTLAATIAQVYPLEQAAEAHRALEHGRAGGKLVLGT